VNAHRANEYRLPDNHSKYCTHCVPTIESAQHPTKVPVVAHESLGQQGECYPHGGRRDYQQEKSQGEPKGI